MTYKTPTDVVSPEGNPALPLDAEKFSEGHPEAPAPVHPQTINEESELWGRIAEIDAEIRGLEHDVQCPLDVQEIDELLAERHAILTELGAE